MAPIFSGSLQSKKKTELVALASAFRLNDQGTKDELQTRIKKYMDKHQPDLEEDPAFAGLFGRRKRSVQPQPSIAGGRLAQPEASPARSAKGRVTAMDPIRESTPADDMRDVSMFLKNPMTPLDKSPSVFNIVTPSSLPPLPPSSPERSIMEHIPSPPNVDMIVQTLKQHEATAVRNGTEMLVGFRKFLSNSRNIWTLTALFELLYVLAVIIPWESVEVAGTTVRYPPWATFQASSFWLTLGHWFLPTFLAPVIFGTLISFHPTTSPLSTGKSTAVAPFDPLTASIVRLAAHIAYPYATLSAKLNTPFQNLDVLGPEWRGLSAAIGVAFSFAEAIALAPQAVAEHTASRHYQRVSDEEEDDN